MLWVEVVLVFVGRMVEVVVFIFFKCVIVGLFNCIDWKYWKFKYWFLIVEWCLVGMIVCVVLIVLMLEMFVI